MKCWCQKAPSLNETLPPASLGHELRSPVFAGYEQDGQFYIQPLHQTVGVAARAQMLQGSGMGGGGGSRTRAQCEDGRDNDNDTKKDYPNDPGCSSRSDENEVDPISIVYRCDDRTDNDRDSLIDLNDPGCINIFDNSEENVNLNQNETEPEIPVIPNKTYENKTAMKIVTAGVLIVIVLVITLLIKIFREKRKTMG